MAKETPIPQGTATPGRKPARAHGRRGGRQTRELRLDRSLDRHLRAFWRSESRAWREMVLAKLNDVPASGRFIDDVTLHPRVGATAAEIRFSDSSRLIVGNVRPAAIVDLAQRVLREDVMLTHAHYPGPFYALNFFGSETAFCLLAGKVLVEC
jgi:hypothetical protein